MAPGDAEPCTTVYLLAPAQDLQGWVVAAADPSLSQEIQVVSELPPRCPWVELSAGTPDWRIRVGSGARALATTTISAREARGDRVSVLVKALSTMSRAAQLELGPAVARRSASTPEPTALPSAFLYGTPSTTAPTPRAPRASPRADPAPLEAAPPAPPSPPPSDAPPPAPSAPAPPARAETPPVEAAPPPVVIDEGPAAPPLRFTRLLLVVGVEAQVRAGSPGGVAELGVRLAPTPRVQVGLWTRGAAPAPQVRDFVGSAGASFSAGVVALALPDPRLPGPALRLGIDWRRYVEAPIAYGQGVTLAIPVVGVGLHQALRSPARRGLRPAINLGLQVDLREQRFVFPFVAADGSVTDTTQVLPPTLVCVQLSVAAPMPSRPPAPRHAAPSGGLR